MAQGDVSYITPPPPSTGVLAAVEFLFGGRADGVVDERQHQGEDDQPEAVDDRQVQPADVAGHQLSG